VHLLALGLVLGILGEASGSPPYPWSPVLRGWEFDWATHQRGAPGSDNWPLAWADDDCQYAAWGDGGGFGGTNELGRVSLGVARISGPFAEHVGSNVWGGHEAMHPATFPGKSYGLLCVRGVLYMWVDMSEAQPERGHFSEHRLAVSRDHGASWSWADWSLTREEGVMTPAFCQFGRDYAGARDGYVYVYLIRFRSLEGPDGYPDKVPWLVVQRPGSVDLARVPRTSVPERAAYSFYAGADASGRPLWTTDAALRQPVFEDAQGVGWCLSVSYSPGLRRYLLCTEHTQSHRGKLGLFEAPQPWGPWTTVAYDNDWGAGHVPTNTFYWNFANKWLSPDGRQFVLSFTGRGENDSWNVVRGRFLPR
jgi:hypothetical protein